MTLTEALQQSKCRRFLRKGLIRYGEDQLTQSDDLVCAAIVPTIRRERKEKGGKMSYLEKAGSSSKTKMLLCVTTERILFISYLFGSGMVYELPFQNAPKLDAAKAKSGFGLGSLTILCDSVQYEITANRKLINHLKAGIMAAFMIYGDRMR